MADTLKFHFTPVDAPQEDEANIHAKTSTDVTDTVAALSERRPDAIAEVNTYAGELTVVVVRDELLEVCRLLKDSLGYTYLSDLAGVDRFTDEAARFEVYYSLVNITAGKRIRLKVRVDEDDAVVPSIVELYKAADWNERECFDMLGIRFEGHPDMRRMYMPEDFEYYPQRKEFPLLGIPGSLPLPPQTPEGELTLDPFAAAHGSRPVNSTQEPVRDEEP